MDGRERGKGGREDLRQEMFIVSYSDDNTKCSYVPGRQINQCFLFVLFSTLTQSWFQDPSQFSTATINFGWHRR